MFAAALPQFLAIGMPYDVFWNGDVSAAVAYREAWRVRNDTANHDAYLQGAYVYDALLRAAPLFNPFNRHPKVQPWLDKPYELSAQRDGSDNVAALNETQADMRAYLENFMARQTVNEAARRAKDA